MEISKYSGMSPPGVIIGVDGSLLGNLLKDFLIILRLNGILRTMLFQYDLQMERLQKKVKDGRHWYFKSR